MLVARHVRLRLARDLGNVLRRTADPRAAIARRTMPAIETALGASVDPASRAVLADVPGGPLVLSVAGSDHWVLKVADDPVSIARVEAEARTLRALHAEPRLGPWRRLVPRLLGTFAGEGWLVTVMERLPGRSVDVRAMDDRALDRWLEVARDVIAPLHDATGSRRPADAATVEAWVLQPLARLEHALLTSGLATSGRSALAAVGETMRAALDAGPLCMGTVHGDYWPGNLLVDERGTITGIVDWEGAQRCGSPVVDTIGLWVASRRRRERRSTGEMAAVLLASDATDATGPAEDGRHGPLGDDGSVTALARAAGLDRRAAILLAWLAALDGTLARQPALARDARWLRRNVVPVLSV